MAHFFLPSPGSPRYIGFAAADNSGLTELIIQPGANATFGVWGGGWNGEVLRIQVYRAGLLVIDNPTPTSSIPDRNIYIYSLQGVRNGDQVYGMLPDGISRFTSALNIVVHKNSANDVIAEWAQHFKAGETFDRPHICPQATPYLALSDKIQGGMTRLNDSNIGGSLNAVHGLAMHCTGMDNSVNVNPYQLARYGCVETWNKAAVNDDVKKRYNASAHFTIAGDGTIIQIIPTDWVAYAQGTPGDTNWISVEIANNGKLSMNIAQLNSSKILFQWVCRQYGVYPALATGCLFQHNKVFDDMTATVCQSAGADLTNSNFEAAMSRGLSCHWWLNPGQHACPGNGILAQMSSIVNPGPFCI